MMGGGIIFFVFSRRVFGKDLERDIRIGIVEVGKLGEIFK